MKKQIILIGWTLALCGCLALPISVQAAEGVSRETPIVRAVRQAAPAVVNISTVQVLNRRQSPFGSFGGDEFFEQFFRDFFDPYHGRMQTRSSLGSGVIIDGRKGFILTNEHVVLRASEIKVALADEREFTAELIGSDPESDLAVLKIKADQVLPALKMGSSSDLMIGETVIAIGNPFGLTHTVTTGVISAVQRTVRTNDRVFRDFIQTDASINPGNSGGPLLNINGDLIGINTAIYDRAEGIGFAIPINKAKRIIKDLISYGEVHPAWLGLSIQSMDDGLARYFNVPAGEGALVTEIDKDGPAARAGLAQGDVLVRLDRNRIRSLDDYEDILKGYTAGVEVALTIQRKGRPMEFKVRTTTYPPQKAERLGWDRYGLQVSGSKLRQGGLAISKIRSGSPAQRVGLERGDILHRINEVEIRTMDDYLKAMTRYRFREGLSAVVQRGRQAYHLTLTP